jgi:hypothetical protein
VGVSGEEPDGATVATFLGEVAGLNADVLGHGVLVGPAAEGQEIDDVPTLVAYADRCRSRAQADFWNPTGRTRRALPRRDVRCG